MVTFFVLFLFCVPTYVMVLLCAKEFHFIAYVGLKYVLCGIFTMLKLGHVT